jgi:hypothetical protein
MRRQRPATAGVRSKQSGRPSKQSGRPSSAVPRRPAAPDLRAQLRKKMKIVKQRKTKALSFPADQPMTFSDKWRLQKPVFEQSRIKHRALEQGRIEIKVVSARNLTADAHDHSSLADPLCQFVLCDATSIVLSNVTYHTEIETTERHVQQTETRYRTRNPRWGTEYTWRCTRFRPETRVEFTIRDCDVDGKQEPMGVAFLNIGKIVFAAQDNDDDGSSLDQSLHGGAVSRQKRALKVVIKGENVGRLHIEWKYTPDGCPIAARGGDMLDRAAREGIRLTCFRALSRRGKRAIGNFCYTPCVDDPKLIVPFLNHIYADLSLSTSVADPEIDDEEFKGLLAVVFHKKPADITGLVRGMDYDASGKVQQSEATNFFLSRSQAAALSGADAGAWHVATGFARKVMTAHGAGGVNSLHSLASSADDSWSQNVVVGLQTGGARIYSENFKKMIEMNLETRVEDAHESGHYAGSWERTIQPIVHCAVDIPPSNVQQRHIPRRIFMACS